MSEYDQSEIQLFKDNVNKFIDKEIEPYYEQWEDEGIVPRELWNKLGAQGLLCIDIPAEFGGIGAPFAFSVALLETFSKRGFGGLGGSMAVHSDIVAHYILNSGTEQQKSDFLPGMVSGEIVGAVAMTEPAAGSDLQGIKTTAKKSDEHYVINGSKTFITNGQHCDIVITVARTNPEQPGARGTSLFIVDTKTEGFERGRNLEKIGLHSSDTSELFFGDVKVHESSILGPLDGGFKVLMNELARERLSLSAIAVSAAEAALEWTLDYTAERKAFGKPINSLQNTRFKLAEMATEIKINRTFIDKCVEDFEAGQLDTTTVSMAKLSTTELQFRVADNCLQLFGGYGYMKEYPISRAFVDARVQRIYGGTSEIMKEIISKDICR